MCNTMKLCFQLDFFSVILGDISESKGYIVNLIILLGKRFIFKATDKYSLNINYFKMFMKHHFILEGCIARRNDDLKRHEERWGKFTEVEGWQ